MKIEDVAIDKISASLLTRRGSLLIPGDVLAIDGGEVVYVEGMTLGDYFEEAMFTKYRPTIKPHTPKIDSRPYYRRLEKRHKRN